VLREIVGEAGLDAETLLEQAESANVKRALRESTDAAIAAGVFGVPAIRVGGELFWGFDDLPFVEQFLAGADPLGSDRTAYAEWSAIRPTAQRTR
jgi:2-hydroxychromene-2-carboxylate isomerase